MATYPITKPFAQMDSAKLKTELTAAGLPVTDVQGGAIGSDQWTIVTSRDLTPAEVATMEGIVAAHDGRTRHPRTLFAIRADLNALSAGQKTAVWSDLSGGSPPKWALDAGRNAAAIAAIEWAATVPAGITAAERTEARLRLAAMYVQDNPAYLVNPAFDPTINVPGDEPDV